MKKFLGFALTLIIVSVMLVASMPTTILAAISTNTTKNKATQENKNGEVIIMYKQKTTDNNLRVKSAEKTNSFLNGLVVKNTLTFEDVEEKNLGILSSNSNSGLTKNKEESTTDYVVSLVKSDKYSTNELINKLSKEESVMYVQKNYKVKATGLTNDTYEKYQWAIENNGLNGGTSGLDINPEKVSSKSSKEKVIAIIDTGVDYTHPELKNRIWNNPYASKGTLLGKHGYDFINEDDDPMDDYGHGTHVAGIIAAEPNNNEGITGAVLDKSNIKIMALKFLDSSGYGDTYGAISAYHYIYKAQQLGVNVVAVNNSWGGGSDKSENILKTAIDLVGNGPKSDGKGALSICAAGNECSNTDIIYNCPSCLDSDYIISVAASTEKDELATFSNYGAQTVDIAAPGADILSTVPYKCFNPSIYENKAKLCSKYESFDSGLNNFKCKASTGNISTASDIYFGQSGKSLNWEFNAEENNYYYLFIPYNAERDSQYFSEMLRFTSNNDNGFGYDIFFTDDNYDEITANNVKTAVLQTNKFIVKGNAQDENDWTHIYGECGKQGTIVLEYYASKDGKVRINIDDCAISNSNAKEEDFGKYDFYSGTSMASPYVSAAVGIASNYKEETALARKNRILGSIRKVNALSDKVMSSGVLDLTYLSNPNIAIQSASINTNGELLIDVVNMGKNTQVFINNKQVIATKVNSKRLKVVNKNLINTTTKITLKESETNYASKTLFLQAGNKYNFENDVYNIESIDNAFTDGKNIYVYSSEMNTVFRIDNEEDMGMFTSEIVSLSDESMKALLGKQWQIVNTDYVENTDFVVINNTIYTIFTFDYGYASDRVLAYYNINKGDNTWRKMANLPNGCNNISMYSLASYNGNLYVIGGYNIANNTISKKVYEFNLSTKKWSTKTDLPEARYAAKATQVGNKLLLSFGGQNDDKVPNILIYDGKNWKKSKARVDLKDYTLMYNDKKYYELETGLVSGGLIFSGINAEKLGNTFYYDIATDSYKKSGYMLDSDKETTGVVVGNKYYVFDMYSFDYELSAYSIPVKTGLSKLTVTYPSTGIKASVNANLYNRTKSNNTLTNIYYYMPGSTMNFNLSDMAGYYIKSFKVDGKEVNGYKYSNVIGADRTIQITTDKVSNLILLNKTSANLVTYNKVNLKATLKNKAATDVKWITSNSSYATVSTSGTLRIANSLQNSLKAATTTTGTIYSIGVVTPKKAGNKKSVTITASTTFRGRKASASAKLNIKVPAK